MTQVYDGDVYEDGQQFKDDHKLIAIFHMRPIKNDYESQIQGRPVFIEVPYIEVLTPGSRDTLVTEATPVYQRRFAKQWEAFKAKQEAPMEGTPLAEVPWLTRAQVAELNAMNVKTIEQLLNMPDSLAQKVMGIHMLKDKANRFLQAAAGEAVTGKLDAKIAEQQAQIDKLLATVDSLTKQLAAKKA